MRTGIPRSVTLAGTIELTGYAITFRGGAGKAMQAAFDGLDPFTKDGFTILRADVPDQAALHGVMERVRALGPELVDVRLSRCATKERCLAIVDRRLATAEAQSPQHFVPPHPEDFSAP